MKPTGRRVLVEPDEPVTMAGSVHLPAQAQEKPVEGKVIAAGDLAHVKHLIGRRVLFSKYGGIEVEHDGKTLLFLMDSDILALLEEGD